MSKKIEIQEAIDFVKENLKDLYRQLEEEERKEEEESNPRDEFEAGQRKLYDYLLQMINWTYYCQEKCKGSFKRVSSPKAYAKEVETIKLLLPRRTGHTTFAKKLFKNFFKKAIYLTENLEMVAGAKELFDPYKTMDPIDLSRMGTMLNVKKGKYKGITPDAIIIDCASFFSKEDVERIYDEFCNVAYKQDHFIFLFLE